MNTDLVLKAEKYCKKLLKNGRCNLLQFHNYEHTSEVAHNAKFLANRLNLSSKEKEMVVIAAYFHDVGNIKTTQGHEKLSCAYAREFLQKENYPENQIQIVENIIQATEISVRPKTILEEIICDADLSHLGMTTFFERNRLLRKEWETFLDMKFTDDEWVKLNVKFLNEHRFYTKAAIAAFENQKKNNLALFLETFHS